MLTFILLIVITSTVITVFSFVVAVRQISLQVKRNRARRQYEESHPKYDVKKEVCDGVFFVRKGNLSGIVSAEEEELAPIKYTALTLPVGSFCFGIVETAENRCNVELIDLERIDRTALRAATGKDTSDMLSFMAFGQFKIHLVEQKKGLQSIAVANPGIFDAAFASEICPKSYQNTSPEIEIYWFSNNKILVQTYLCQVEHNDDYDMLGNF